MSPNPDWQKIEEEVIYGYIDETTGQRHFPNLKESAERHNIKYETLRKRASRGQWLAKQETHVTKVSQKIVEKKTEYSANEVVISDDKFMATGEKLRLLIDVNMTRDLEYVQKEGGFVKPYHLKMYGDGLSSAQNVIKTAQGDLVERISMEQNTKVSLDDNTAQTVRDLFKFAKKGGQD